MKTKTLAKINKLYLDAKNNFIQFLCLVYNIFLNIQFMCLMYKTFVCK